MSLTEEQEAALQARYGGQKGRGSPVDQLRAHCLSHGVCGIRTIARVFRRLDDNGDKRLSVDELQEALSEAGVRADRATAQQCFNQIDRDGSGSINFDEFLIALRPPLSDQGLSLINQAFDKLDKTGDGQVDLDDIRGVYSAKYHPKFQSGEWTEDQVFDNWLRQIGGADDGVISRDDFINYYVAVSSSIDDDGYFVEMMRSAWKL